MRGREGFLAVGTLCVVMVVLASRGFDGGGAWNPTRDTAAVRFETGATGEREIVLSAGPNGHFFFEAEANGAPIRFMVDSGASIVTLTESDARRAGLVFSPSDYNRPFDTANGTVMGAVGEIAELRIGEAILDDLFVSVVPDRALSGSLFGVNGLNRFDRRQVTRDELVLSID